MTNISLTYHDEHQGTDNVLTLDNLIIYIGNNQYKETLLENRCLPPVNPMSSSQLTIPTQQESLKLGEILQAAHLISSEQLKIALFEQSLYPDERLGEILVKQGRIKQQTADFFAECWPYLVKKSPRHSRKRLGEYLLEAALLTPEQIEEILAEQQHGGLWQRFGAKAAFKGLISVTTVDFFLINLFPDYAGDSPFTKPKH